MRKYIHNSQKKKNIKSDILSITRRKEKVKTAKGRKISSTKWINRHINDPYVISAKLEGYLSRAAYKLIEMDKKYEFLKSSSAIVEFGAVPGSWSQVILNKSEKKKIYIANDLLEMKYYDPRISFFQGDIENIEIQQQILNFINQNKININLILSDISPNLTGDTETDRILSERINMSIISFCKKIITHNLKIILKTIKGSDFNIYNELKQICSHVKRFKPNSSRKDSSEIYLIAW